MTFNELEWFVDDLGMGGQSAKGDLCVYIKV